MLFASSQQIGAERTTLILNGSIVKTGRGELAFRRLEIVLTNTVKLVSMPFPALAYNVESFVTIVLSVQLHRNSEL